MSEYDAMRRVINHEANQDDDGGFFAKLGGIEPDPDDDGPTAKGLFQHMDRDNGGYLPGPPQPVKLKDGERIWVKEGDDLVEYEHQVDNHGESWRLVKVGKIPNRRKRKPIVKLRKRKRKVFTLWKWECRICHNTGWSFTWNYAYTQASHHAHNHHGKAPR